MTTYTADDFKRAEFARHPDGGIAARVKVARHPSSPWADVKGYITDEGMALEGWVPVEAGSYTRTDEEDWQARAVTAEQALVEMTAHRDQCRDAAIKWQVEANRAVQPRALTPDAITDEMVERYLNHRDPGEVRDWRLAGYRDDLVEKARAHLVAALAEPTRPEGAEDIETDLRPLDLGGVATPGQVADHLAALGYRKTGAES